MTALKKTKQLPAPKMEIIHNPTPTDLIASAIEKNVSIEVLERLMALQKDFQAQQARKAFFESFGKFQAQAPELIKNKQVSFRHKDNQGTTNYKYQELGDIAKHIRQPLANSGLSYRWDQKEEGNIITVWCIISHLDGHEEKSSPLSGQYDDSGSKNKIQQKASTITYLRRYTLTGMLGLSTMEGDNDGKGGALADPIASTVTVILPIPSNEQFSEIMKKVVKGGQKAFDETSKHFSFNEEQISSLKIAGNLQ